jgi:hypothetical protein
MHGEPRQEELDAYSESLYPRRFGWSPVRALRAGRYKLIEAPRGELYDLDTDPFEQRNIYEERRTLARGLGERLATFERNIPAGPRDRVANPMPPVELQQRLASLGYVGSSVSYPPSDRPDLPDAKDCIRGQAGSAAAQRCAAAKPHASANAR